MLEGGAVILGISKLPVPVQVFVVFRCVVALLELLWWNPRCVRNFHNSSGQHY